MPTATNSVPEGVTSAHVDTALEEYRQLAQISDRRIDDIHRRIRNVLRAYPATDWSLEESRAVLNILHEIVRFRNQGVRGAGLEAAAAEIARQEQWHAEEREKAEARAAAAVDCDLCDENGWSVGPDGEQLDDKDWNLVECLHGKATPREAARR